MGFENFRKNIATGVEVLRIATSNRKLEKHPELRPVPIEVDSDTVRLYIPGIEKYMSILFTFPTLDQHDAFMQSRRTKYDFDMQSGFAYIYMPGDETRVKVDFSDNGTDDPYIDSKNATTPEICKAFDIPAAAVFFAFQDARTAWLASLEKVKDKQTA